VGLQLYHAWHSVFSKETFNPLKPAPIGALALCWFIGIVFGKPGLWFPIGLLAMVAIAMMQARQEPPQP
jgi:hypothetical protein